MYKYEYVSVKIKIGFWNDKIENYREIIDGYANRGWRFVAAVPTATGMYGRISDLDLVFEKEV